MMQTFVVILAVLPLVAILVSVLAPVRVGGWATAVAGLASFVLAVALVPGVAGASVSVGFLRVDALSLVFLLATAFLYFAVAVYSFGYLRAEREMPGFPRYARLYHAGLNAFAWSMLCAPMMNGLALLWVAVEITTIVSALLVAIDDTEGATEAAWKYVLLASTGLGIALLGTIFMYYAGSQVLGTGYDLAFQPLLAHGAQLPATPVRFAFVLAVVGFGTKVGLVPMHTWLPDAHAEAPTPVSALLSGALLAVSFYAIVRYFQVTVVAVGTAFPRGVLVVFGVASVLLAATYLLGQRDVKRLLAYSSVEHMGIVAIGLSFGVPIAAFGVLLHILAHAAAKGGAFMGAGVMVRAFHTKDLRRIRNGIRVLPYSAPLFLLLVLGLSGLPPGGIFRSEFQIVAGGFQAGASQAGILIVLVTVAFVGLVTVVSRMVASPAEVTVPSGEPSRTMVLALLLCLAALVLLGVHPPGPLDEVLRSAAAQLVVP